MRIPAILSLLALASATCLPQASAADNLRLNQHLDYSSDSQDGPLITGDDLKAGSEAGKPNYIIIYGEGCYNSKRQARRTVELYGRYQGRVHFVVIDLDGPRSPGQEQLIQRYYKGYIPTVVILDAAGRPVYAQSGEEDQAALASILDKALR